MILDIPSRINDGIKIFMLILFMSLPYTGFARNDSGEFYRTRQQENVLKSTDVMLVALPAAAVTAVLVQKDWEGLKEGAITAALAVGTTYLLKYTIPERRPDGSDCHSFPSGHSSITFAAATFIGQRYGWKWGIPVCAVAGYTAWGRVYGKKHHWWDAATGAAIGAISAVAFTHPYLKKHEVAIAPVATDTEFGLVASFSF